MWIHDTRANIIIFSKKKKNRLIYKSKNMNVDIIDLILLYHVTAAPLSGMVTAVKI